MTMGPVSPASSPGSYVGDPFLMLTPAGVLHAFSERDPDEEQLGLQTLLPRGPALSLSQWATSDQHHAWLQEGLVRGWIHTVQRSLHAPDVKLDDFLTRVVAGLSGERKAAIASDAGFCLGFSGYSAEEAEMLSVAAVDFFEFATRQKHRGWQGSGRAISFHEEVDMLMPATSFVLFWVDGVGYWLIVGGEPLLNNVALVELVWGIKAAGARFGAS